MRREKEEKTGGRSEHYLLSTLRRSIKEPF
jgi:hypothetical protein